MDKVSCLKCGQPLFITDKVYIGTLYVVRCANCERDHYFSVRVPGRRKWVQPDDVERLGSKVTLEVKCEPLFKHLQPDYKGSLQSSHSFLPEKNVIDQDQKTMILYEALADGEITEDLFNKFIMRM